MHACQHTPAHTWTTLQHFLHAIQHRRMSAWPAQQLVRVAVALAGSWRLASMHLTLHAADFLRCRGTLPDTMSGLSKLQWLLLDNNKISGPLPAYLGGLLNLQQAQLQNNNFSGPVPQQWCAGAATFHVMHNPNLCGKSPPHSCLLSTGSTDGTLYVHLKCMLACRYRTTFLHTLSSTTCGGLPVLVCLQGLYHHAPGSMMFQAPIFPASPVLAPSVTTPRQTVI